MKNVKRPQPEYMPPKEPQVVIPSDTCRKPHSTIRNEGLKLECRNSFFRHCHWAVRKCSYYARRVIFALQMAQANDLFITQMWKSAYFV